MKALGSFEGASGRRHQPTAGPDGRRQFATLAGYAGRSVTLRFTGVEDASLPTSFVVDDTAVTVA